MLKESNERIQQKLDDVKKQFETRIAKIQENGSERIKKTQQNTPDANTVEAILNIVFEIQWKISSIKFDIPKFSMRKEIIKFDVPEVSMELKTIKFDVPATRMVRTCLFKKPEIRARFPRVKVDWVCVWGDKPEPYMKTVEISTKIPKFSMKKTEIIFDKPVIKLETIEIKLHLPQVFVKQLSGELREQKRELENIGQDMTFEIAQAEQEMKISLQTELTNEIKDINDDIREDILKERENVVRYYDEAISKTKSAIKILKENNANEEVSRLESELSKIVADYKNILIDIDNNLENIGKDMGNAISEIKI
jgi:hypothetical protein